MGPFTGQDKRSRDKPERYYHVSHTQLSVARFTGQIQVNGTLYHYNAADDTLTRDDVWKRGKKTKRGAKREREKWEQSGLNL